MAEKKIEDKPDLPKASSETNLMADMYTGTAENTYFRSPMVPASYLSPYNSDDLFRKTGDYRIYEEMGQDDQVSICLQLKKDLILGSGYEIVTDDESQEEMADEIKVALDDSDTPFLDSIAEVQTAYDFGFSLTEKIFKLVDGKLALASLKTRHPASWLIHQDDKGNVSKYQQRTVAGDLDINPKSLIHFVNNRKFQNPYGVPDLRSAYKAYFAKCQVVRFYAIFLEKGASPIPVGRYNKNAPPGTGDTLLDILKKFQSKTAITIPDDVKVEFLEAKSNGEAYSKALNIFNMFIGRSLFIPDLLGMSGSETSGGSHALGKEQMGVFFMHINRRRASLEQLINKHLIQPIVMYNYGDIPNYPKFKFKPLDDAQAMELAKVWLDAVKGKTFKANDEEINHFRSLVKFPEGLVQQPEPPPQLTMGPDGKPLPDDPKDPKADLKLAGKEPIDKEVEKKEKQTFAKVFNLPPGNYHKKCDFKAIAAKLNDYDESLLSETQPIVKKMFDDLYDQVQRKKILSNASRMDSLELKYKAELKKVLKSSLMSIFKDGQIQAAKELNKNDFSKPQTSEEFLALLEQETFNYIGDYEYRIISRVKTELTAAIKDGKPLSTVLDIMDVDGKKLSEASLERFARTKHTEVLNKGRMDFFEASGVVAAYQYSAILDDRTSDICAGLDGKIFTAGSEPIPPMHFNCRSLLIPITKYEEFKPSETVGKQDIRDFIEENKGTGFATN